MDFLDIFHSWRHDIKYSLLGDRVTVFPTCFYLSVWKLLAAQTETTFGGLGLSEMETKPKMTDELELTFLKYRQFWNVICTDSMMLSKLREVDCSFWGFHLVDSVLFLVLRFTLNWIISYNMFDFEIRNVKFGPQKYYNNKLKHDNRGTMCSNHRSYYSKIGDNFLLKLKRIFFKNANSIWFLFKRGLCSKTILLPEYWAV